MYIMNFIVNNDILKVCKLFLRYYLLYYEPFHFFLWLDGINSKNYTLY